MNQDIFDWFLLLVRWLHITTAVTWIGTSFFFMWLDRTLEKSSDKEGHVGALWMVHGGGFYHVEKMLLGPTKVPDHLHWFKWESYWTWLSGFFLILMVFYTGSGTFLLDSSVSNISYLQGVVIGFSSMFGSWFFYDFLWERKITKDKPVVGHVLTLLWFAGMSYFLCSTLSGRAAYMHIGAMLGTWMSANVFLRIIPRQIKMVKASANGNPVNQEWGKNAKSRSTHNTYFTLPIIFIMMSNHFPSTYGSNINWLILLLMSAAGAAIRHYFVIRVQQPARAKGFCAIGVAIIIGVIFLTCSHGSTSSGHLEPITETHKHAISAVNEKTFQLKGVVRFEGEIPEGERLFLPPGCNDLPNEVVYKNDISISNHLVKNVVARVTDGLGSRTFIEVPTEAVFVDQKNCQYEPRVSGVRVGQKVEFINSDPVFHNVRAISKHNDEFNVGMPSKDERMTKIFYKPEIFLQTKCSVHPWMTAYIAVMEHPFFSVTNDFGEFTIKDLPEGEYTLELWHEVFGVQKKDFALHQDLSLEFTYKK